MLKRFIAVLLCIILTFVICGCESTDDAYIYMELNQTPVTLDPQTASSDTEQLIIKNIFEGLLRKSDNGDIVCGAAESYIKNGLTYTFKIKKDLIWSDETPITSHDFAFGITRALLPATNSPFASRLYSIIGAKDVHTGVSSVSSLGIETPDDNTLIITLEYDDPYFEETLTSAVAMPCNQVFFSKTDGQYGLFAQHILSNGSYRITRWRKDPFGIRLYKNKYYSGEFTALNAAVFLTADKEETPFERLKENNVDIAFIDTVEKEEADSLGLNTYEINNVCWFLTISDRFTPNTKKALAMLVGGEVYSKNLKSGYSVANTIYPDVLNLDFTPNGITAYNVDDGKALFFEEVSALKDKKFPTDVTLYYYDDGNVKSAITDIVGHWQNNLSAFVNIEAVSSPDLLESQIKTPSYDMAIFPIHLKSARYDEYIEIFNGDYCDIPYNEAQAEILKTNNIIPIIFQTTNISYTSALKNVIISDDNGFIDFSFIVKYE